MVLFIKLKLCWCEQKHKVPFFNKLKVHPFATVGVLLDGGMQCRGCAIQKLSAKTKCLFGMNYTLALTSSKIYNLSSFWSHLDAQIFLLSCGVYRQYTYTMSIRLNIGSKHIHIQPLIDFVNSWCILIVHI